MIYKLYEKLSNELRNKEKKDVTKGYAVYEISYRQNTYMAISMGDNFLHCCYNDDINDFVENKFRSTILRYFELEKTSENSYTITDLGSSEQWTVTKLKDKGE
jgi:hypothetical protein